MSDPLDIRNPTWTRERVLATAIALPVVFLLFVFLDGYRAVVWTARGIVPMAMIWFPDTLGVYVNRVNPTTWGSGTEPASYDAVTILGWVLFVLWVLICLLSVSGI